MHPYSKGLDSKLMTTVRTAAGPAKNVLARTLRAQRLARGLSLLELERRSGVYRQQIALYEAGDADPSASALLLLARALGSSIDALLEHAPALPA